MTPRWRRLSMALLAGVVLGLYVPELGSHRLQSLVCWAAIVVMQVWDAVIALMVARAPRTPPPARRFFTLLALATAVWAVGSLNGLLEMLLTDEVPDDRVSWVHLASLGVGGVLVIAAMLGHPLTDNRRERRRMWLDSSIVVVVLCTVAWHVSGVSPQYLLDAPTDAARELLGPAVFGVAGFGLVKVSLSRTPPLSGAAAAVAGVAVVLECLSTGYGRTLAEAGHPAWFNALGLSANWALLCALHLQRAQVARPAPTRPHLTRRRSYSLLPYLAVAGIDLMLVRDLHDYLVPSSWVLLIATLAATALVVGRQLVALADNDELVRRLDEQLTELERAHTAVQNALAERDRLAETLRHRADHDDLTGLANRNLFLTHLEAALQRSRRGGPAVGVLMIDLNDFKPVNDTYGHHAGDQVLRHVADAMRAVVRETDVVARFGGDEFAVLVPDEARLDAVSERLREAISAPLDLGTAQVRVGASIGAVGAPGGQETAEALLRRADAAMYEVKRTKTPERAARGSS